MHNLPCMHFDPLSKWCLVSFIFFPLYIQCEMGSFLFHVYIQSEMGSFLFPVYAVWNGIISFPCIYSLWNGIISFPYMYIFSVKWDHFFSLYIQSEIRSFLFPVYSIWNGNHGSQVKKVIYICLFRLLVPGVPRKILKLTRVWLCES